MPSACGTDRWAGLADVYVDASAEEGGDGSSDSPLQTIQAGADLAGEAGGTVGIAAGRYVENLVLGYEHDGVTLSGRCAALTIVDGREGEGYEATLLVGDRRAPSVVVRSLTVTAGPFGVLADASTLVLNDVVVTANQTHGVGAFLGATVTMTDVVVSDTTPDDDGDFGRGVGVEDNSTFTCERCTIENNVEQGIRAGGTSTMTLIDTLISGTTPTPSGSFGNGVQLTDDAQLEMSGSLVTGNTAYGMYVHERAVANIVESQVTDTVPAPDGGRGEGIAILDAAQATLQGVTIRGNSEAGLYVGGTDAGIPTAAVQDTTVADTLPSSEGNHGQGLIVGGGAVVEAVRLTLAGNSTAGILVSGAGTRLTLDGGLVTDTRRGRIVSIAPGILVQDDAEVVAVDVEVSGDDGPGLYVSEGGAVACTGCGILGSFADAIVVGGVLTLDGSEMYSAAPDAALGGGFGIYVTSEYGEGTVTVTNSVVSAQSYAGLWLDGDGAYDLQGNEIAGSAGVDGIHGNAVFAQSGVGAWDGEGGLRIIGNRFSGSPSIAVFLDASSAVLDGNSWPIEGVSLRQQRCDGVVALQGSNLLGVPTSEICPETNVLTAYDVAFSTLYLATAEAE